MKIASDGGQSQLFMSMEWTAPKDAIELDKCIEKAIESCKTFKAKFCSVSWHCSDFNLSGSPILKFACEVQKSGIDVIAHLTPQNLTKSQLLEILHHLKNNGIKHVFALRGDINDTESTACFSYAKEFVLFIRNNFGNYFKIFVAGYPSGHSDKLDKDLEIQYLKDKVDAGADYIITQTVFDASQFVRFVKRCREIGIDVPIIPGIMPVQDAELLLRLDNKCKFHITKDVYDALNTFKSADDELINFGIQKARDILAEIIKSGIGIQGVHFFTLNRPKPAMQVWEQLSIRKLE